MWSGRRSKDEWTKYHDDLRRSIDYEQSGLKEEILGEARGELQGVKHPATLLLDSSLISQTKNKKYNAKIIECGNYIQVYLYENCFLKKDENKETMKKIDVNYLFKKENVKKKNDLKVIEYKNIMRSKFQMQRIVKANEDKFKTFITLTFEDNVTSVEESNKCFNSFRTYIKKLKSDFVYVCVPEFQARGAVHYHLLTNIDYTDFSLLSKDEKKIYKKKKGWQIFRTIKGWNKGFTSVIPLSDINVVGYISKYMTKDIDNRLFSKKRYMYSLSLNKPKENFFDLSNDKELLIFLKSLNDVTVSYKKTYLDYYGTNVDFYEYKKRS